MYLNGEGVHHGCQAGQGCYVGGCICVGKESFRSYRVVMVVRVVWSGGYNCMGMVPTRSPMAVRVARIVLVIRSCGCI